MKNFDSAYLFFAVGALVLVFSALSFRNIGFFKVVKMALSWLMIFALLFLLFSYRYELEPTYERMKREISGDTSPEVIGDEVRIRLGMDNHFSVDVMVNGKPVTMLIDSGASFTAMGDEMAKSLGIVADASTLPRIVQTANGTVKAYPAHIKEFKLGTISRTNMTVYIAPEFGDFAVIGMNFLSSLKGWRVESQEMILQP